MISMQSGLRCMRESAPSEPLDGYPAIDYNLMLKPSITTLWKFANNPLAPHPSVYGWIPIQRLRRCDCTLAPKS
jgi:hypothetical protein